MRSSSLRVAGTALLLLLLAASTADAVLRKQGGFAVYPGGVDGRLAVEVNGFISAAGDGIYTPGYISTVAGLFTQDGYNLVKPKPSFIGVPLGITTYNTSSASLCLYYVTAAGLSILNTTSFANAITCPTLISGVAMAYTTGSSGVQWSAQCTASALSITPGVSATYTCRDGVAAANVNKTNPLVYMVAQFGQGVMLNTTDLLYQMYFVAVATGGVPTTGMNVTMVLSIGSQTAFSPPPPSPPGPPSPPVNGALTSMPATGTLALALLAGQLLSKLMQGSD